MAFRELSLFAGGGGGLLGSRILGWYTVCAVEIDPKCRRDLLQRQIDGCLDPFPVWDDIRTFDPAPWRGKVDIITGGFPCQGISSAGKRLGLADPRSGLVFEMLWAINVIRPPFVLAENSPQLRTNGLGSILEALASMGYAAQWGVLGAWHAGAPHRRDRLWIVATHTDSEGEHARPVNAEMAVSSEPVSNADSKVLRTQSGRPEKGWEGPSVAEQHGELGSLAERPSGDSERQTGSSYTEGHGLEEVREFDHFGKMSQGPMHRWPPEPGVGRVAHGVANRMDRLRAIGNGQVPRVAALAWEVLK